MGWRAPWSFLDNGSHRASIRCVSPANYRRRRQTERIGSHENLPDCTQTEVPFPRPGARRRMVRRVGGVRGRRRRPLAGLARAQRRRHHHRRQNPRRDVEPHRKHQVETGTAVVERLVAGRLGRSDFHQHTFEGGRTGGGSGRWRSTRRSSASARRVPVGWRILTRFDCGSRSPFTGAVLAVERSQASHLHTPEYDPEATSCPQQPHSPCYSS